MYSYQAEVVRWVDGDTVILDVDMGFRIRVKSSFRLIGVDTPERGQLGYALAIEAVNTWAPVGSTVHIRTHPDPDKYGRWLVQIDTPRPLSHFGEQDVDYSGASVNALLIEAGLAKPYDGGRR